MTPDPTEPTSANADSAPVSANEPQRSAEVQAALDWLMPDSSFEKLPYVRRREALRIIQCKISTRDVKAGDILRAEVLRLESALAAEKARADKAESERDEVKRDRDYIATHWVIRCESIESERDKLREAARRAVHAFDWYQPQGGALARIRLAGAISKLEAAIGGRSATTPKGATQP